MKRIILFLVICCFAILGNGMVGIASDLKQEKIYIHTDKPFYLTGDTIWMKGYLVDAKTHKEQDVQSRFMYVELIDNKNKVLLRKKLKEENGIYRNFFSLESDIPEGQYMLRGYTNYMRNGDEAFFFTKQISVCEGLNSLLVLKVRYKANGGKRHMVVTLLRRNGEPYAGKQVEYMVRTKTYKNKLLFLKTNKAGEVCIQIPPKQELSQYVELTLKDGSLNITRKIELPDVYDYHVGFYPEGGYLLAGVEQVVAFKAEATTGISPCIKGYVMNLAGDTLVSFQSEHEGIGSFALTAETGDSLFAITYDESGVEKRFLLPPAVSDKIALTVMQDDSLIHYKVCVPKKYILLEELKLLAHVRGQIVCRNKIASGKLSGRFSKKNVPEGILHLTVFNAEEQALTERLVFVCQDTCFFQVATFGSPAESRSLLKMGIKLVGTDYSPLEGNFSMSITDDFAVHIDSENGNIRSTLLLSSDLKGHIPTPGYYLENSMPERKKHLDQLLLTQGWSRFPISSLLYPAVETEQEWEPEQVQTIWGNLKGWFNKRTRRPVRMSVAVPKFGQIHTVTTDRNGVFKVTHDCPDMTGFIITPSKKKAQEYTVELKEDTYPEVKGLEWEVTGRPRISAEYLREMKEGYEIINGEKVYKIPEVTVKGVSPHYGYAYKSIATTFIEQQKAANALELLNQMPEVCIYQVMKRLVASGAPVPTGERHVGLLKREAFIEGYLSGNLIGPKAMSGDPKSGHREHFVKSSAINSVIKRNPHGRPLNESQCVRVNIYVDDVKVQNENNLEKLKASDVRFIDMLNNPKLSEEERLLSHWVQNVEHAWSSDNEQRYRDTYGQSIQITTARLNRGRFVESLPHIAHVVPLGYAKQAEFYSPKYSTEESRKIVNSDIRSTIHWVPDLHLNEQGEALLSFYTVDRPSSYTVLIEGVTTEGRVCRCVKRIKGKDVLQNPK